MRHLLCFIVGFLLGGAVVYLWLMFVLAVIGA